MATNFPTSLDSFTNPTASDTLNSATVPHATQHANANDAIEALEAKVGIDGSAVATSLEYRVNALETAVPGATTWGSITGTLSNQTDLDTALAGKSATTHNHDATYAPLAKGVTNGDTHDHSGGDGAQIDHGGLAGLSDDDHTQYHNDTRGDARYIGQGLHTMWIPAVAMISRTTSGAATGSVETTTNKVMLKTLDFDAATDEFAQFQIRMPKSWDEGTVTAAFTWTANSTSTNSVVWGCQAVSLSDDDALDTAFGTAQTVTDANKATAYDVNITAATSAITIAGTPAAEDWVAFQVYRDADNGSDNLAADALLLGVTIYMTLNAATDA